MAADFPEVLLTTEQLAAVKAALLDRVFDMDGTIQLCYYDCTFRPGYLVFSCKDEAYGAGEDMIHWKGAKLTTVKEKELPRTQKATAFFPFRAEDSNDRILGFLRKQNAVLKVEC